MHPDVFPLGKWLWGQRGPPRVQGPYSLYLPCLDVAQLWALCGWHVLMKCSPRSWRLNQASCSKFCSVLANMELTNQIFLAGILETNLRGGVGCSLLWSTDARCEWGVVVWPFHTKTLIVSSCFCKAFQHQCLCKLFGIFSWLNPVCATILIRYGLCWARPHGVLSPEKHWARYSGLDECFQKLFEGSSKVPIQVCQS